jgi:3-hydroxybutyryl-CoA dehydrogenase
VSLSRIGVIGAGIMGCGIAQLSATRGFEVLILDVSEEALRRGMNVIGAGLERLVSSDKLTSNQRDTAIARIRTTTAYEQLNSSDLVIEAATEDLAIKRRIIRHLDEKLPRGAILASNTSSLSITVLAAGMTHPERFIGIHFFNPVSVMPLVELIRGVLTSLTTLSGAASFVELLGKTAINAKNSPGFAINRILCPMINEAIFALQEGIASAADIDVGMKLGCNHPIGPLALADLIGLDTLLSIMEVFQRDLGDPKYRPAPLLREMVASGRLGRKSGHGFFSYR